MILIVTCCDDIHADILQARLTKRGEKSFRVNVDKFPGDYQFEFSASNNVELLHSKPVLDGVLHNLSSQSEVRLSDISAVWLRKIFHFDAGYGEKKNGGFYSMQSECDIEQTLMSTLYALNCFWMSHPKYLYTSCWRGEQLQRAVRLGFRVPDSIITNQRNAAMAFTDNQKNGVTVKPLALSLPLNSGVSPSSETSKELRFDSSAELADSRILNRIDGSDGVRPKLLQENIPALFELRVVVVDQHVFSTKQEPVQGSEPHIDVYHLPDIVQRSCAAFVRSYGLTYGVLRLLMTTDNEIVFLENNPAGEFWDVEQRLPELQIMNALADTLTQGRA